MGLRDHQSVPFTFTRAGRYEERLHGNDDFDAAAGAQSWLLVPGNYGRVWTTTSP